MKTIRKILRSKFLQYRKLKFCTLPFYFLFSLLIALMIFKHLTQNGDPLNYKFRWGDKNYKTRLLLRRAAHNNTVLVTTSNFMYREQLRNFQCTLDRLNLSYYPVVFSQDRDTHYFAKNHSFASILLSDQLGDNVKPGKFIENGTRSFGNITRNKFDAVLTALNYGMNVVVSDADIHWCSDALSMLLQMNHADPSSDIIIMAEPQYKTLNSGFYFVRATDRTRKLFEIMRKRTDIGNHDQDVLNAVLCGRKLGANRVIYSESNVPYYCITKNKVRVKILPSEQWPSGAQVVSGRTIFSYSREELRHMCETKKIFVLHNNFVTAKKKKARMVVKGMWFVESEESMECLNQALLSSKKYVRTCGIYCTESDLKDNNGEINMSRLNQKYQHAEMDKKFRSDEENITPEAKEIRGEIVNDNHVRDILVKSTYKKTALVTVSNYKYRTQLRNFQCSLSRLKIPYSPVVFALDKKIHEFSKNNGLESILVSTEQGQDSELGNFEKKGPHSFGSITRMKLFAVYKVLKLGFDVLLSDADIHWCDDVLGNIKDLGGYYNKADIIAMPEMNYSSLNSGFYYVRANKKTQDLFDLVMKNYDIGNHDQDVFNEILCSNRFGSDKIYLENERGRFYCEAQSGAIVHVLDANFWPSGGQNIDGISLFSHSRSRIIRMCKRKRFYLVHNNYVRASRKEPRVIVKGLWYVSDDGQMRCLKSPAPVSRKAKSRCSSSCFEPSTILKKKIHYADQDLKTIENGSFRNVTLVTSANYMYRSHLRNFQCALKRLSLQYQPIVFSQDRMIHEFCAANGLRSILITSEFGQDMAPGNFTKFGFMSFSFITRLKFQAVRFALESGKNVLFSDSDIHWCVDIINELENLGYPYGSADMIVAPEAHYSQLNSGFYFVRSNNKTKELFEEMMNASEFGNHDQDVFNAFLCNDKFGAIKLYNEGNSDVPFYCKTKKGIVVQVLPAKVWPSGNEIVNGISIFKNSRQDLMEMCNSGAVNIIHNNFIKARSKEARMKVKGMWFVNNDDKATCAQQPIHRTSESKGLCGKYCR